MDLCIDKAMLDNFLLYTDDADWCVLYKSGQILITWYKHLGRANTCTKNEFTIDDLAYFWKLLKKDIDMYEAKKNRITKPTPHIHGTPHEDFCSLYPSAFASINTEKDLEAIENRKEKQP